MINLRPVDYLTVAKFFVDFQKHSKNFELPSDEAQIVGIFNQDSLIGYYIIQGYDNKDVEIIQGYLIPSSRHANLPIECMRLLEQSCKKAGYSRMMLATGSRFRAYLKFAKGLGYKPTHLEFSKEL